MVMMMTIMMAMMLMESKVKITLITQSKHRSGFYEKYKYLGRIAKKK